MPLCYNAAMDMQISTQWMHKIFEDVHVNSSEVTFSTMRCSLRGEMLVTGVDIQRMLSRIGRDKLQSYLRETVEGEVTGTEGAFDAPDMTYALERMWATIFSNEFKQYN